MSNYGFVQYLKEELDKPSLAQVEDGAVLRWQEDRFTYAALYVRDTDRWYLTGQLTVGLSTATLVRRLRAKAQNVRMALTWTRVTEERD